jgi:nucleoid-associated protein YgaU
MIIKNLGYIVTIIVLIISGILIFKEFSDNQNITQNTSSASTIRDEEDKKNTYEENNSETTKHIIQKGDTLWDLSVKYYADGTKYHEIIKKNPGKTFKFDNGREGLIYPGTELEI